MIILCILVLLFSSTINTEETTTKKSSPAPSSSKSISVTQAYEFEENFIFQAMQFPLSAVQDSFTKNIITEINTVFGQDGIKLTDEQVQFVQKTYLYLIFLAKLDAVKTNPKFTSYQTDFKQYLESDNESLPYIPDETVITSKGWGAVTVSNNDLINSQAWQLFCKAMVCNSYSYFYAGIDILHTTETEMFNYIPHIETSFYDQDFTQLRSINEVTRVKIILEQTTKTYFQSQCADWKNLPNLTTSSKNNQTLENAISAFRKTTFYQNTHNMYSLLNLQPNSTITHSNLMSPKLFTSPLREQIWCFFMLKEVLSLLYASINIENLSTILTTCSSSKLTPNIFPYTTNDYVYFDDFLALQSKNNGTSSQSLHPSPETHKVENTHLALVQAADITKSKNDTNQAEESKDVEIQSIWDFFKSIGSDVATGFEDVGKGIEDAAKAVGHFAESTAEGIAGFGASLVADVGGAFGANVSSIRKWGTAEQKAGLKELKKASSDLQSATTDFAKGIASGYIGPMAQIDGDLVGDITGDHELGASITGTINQVSDAMVTVTSKMAGLAMQASVEAENEFIKVNAAAATMVASVAVGIFTGNVGNQSFWNNMANIVTTTVDSITATFSNLVTASEAVMKATVTALGGIINSMTSLFINLSREISYIATLAYESTIGGIVDAAEGKKYDPVAQAKKVRDHVTSVLNAHRSTINQVMGVAVAVGFDVGVGLATDGAGEAEADSMDTAILEAGEQGAEAGADAGEDAGMETGEQAGEQTGEETGEETGEQTGEDSSQESDDESEYTKSFNQNETPDDMDNPDDDSDDDDSDEDDDDSNENKKESKLKKVLQEKWISLVLNSAFGAFNIISGINNDNKNSYQEQQEAEQLRGFFRFINNSKISTAQSVYNYLKELRAKQQAELGNQSIGLTLLKNSLYGSIDATEKTIAENLSKNAIAQLTPNSNNNSIPANIGTTWGLITNYLDLYPTEGYTTTTDGRKDFPFAQEVAQSPTIQSSSKSKLSSTKTTSTLWFNQKNFALDLKHENGQLKKSDDPLTVTIDLEFLYMLQTEFYVGLYLGGNYHDYNSPEYLEALKKENNFDLDVNHLAKMVVLFRKKPTDPISIGVYENEGKGWITQQQLPSSMQLNQHHSYQLTATLNNDSLDFTITADQDTQNKINKTITVTPLDNQRTYGIIYSGAAIQWNQITPKSQLSVNALARPNNQPPNVSNAISEIDREKQSKIRMLQAKQPVFGSMKLQALSQQSLLFGHYLYTTTDTNLIKVNSTLKQDYLLFGQLKNNTVSPIGMHPPFQDLTSDQNPNVVISVITGNVYDEQGNIVKQVANVWSNYKDKTSFSEQINSYITTAQKTYNNRLATIKFGDFNLNIISQEALQQGLYIYSCNQTITKKDSDGKSITDYLVATKIQNDQADSSTVGMSPLSTNAQGLVSLVTNKLYAKDTTVTSGKTPTALSSENFELGQLTIDSTDMSLITDAQTAYEKAVTAPPKPTKKKPLKLSTQTASSNDFSINNNPSHGLSIGSNSGGGLHLGPPPKHSISSLQTHGASSSGFQLKSPSKGLTLGGSKKQKGLTLPG